MGIVVRDDTDNNWHCPHCNRQGCCAICDGSVLKNDYEEILVGCYNCNGLHIRKYSFKRIIPVFMVVPTQEFVYDEKLNRCPHCKTEKDFKTYVEDLVLENTKRNIMYSCSACSKLHIESYEFDRYVLLNRQDKV